MLDVLRKFLNKQNVVDFWLSTDTSSRGKCRVTASANSRCIAAKLIFLVLESQSDNFVDKFTFHLEFSQFLSLLLRGHALLKHTGVERAFEFCDEICVLLRIAQTKWLSVEDASAKLCDHRLCNSLVRSDDVCLASLLDVALSMDLVDLTLLTEQLEERVLQVSNLNALIEILDVDGRIGFAHRLGSNLFQLRLEGRHLTLHHLSINF